MLKTAFIRGVAAAAALTLMAAGTASAQECVETQFGSKTGQLYLNAETELLVNKNAQAALQSLNQLRAMELNCYEEGAALRLSAAIKVETRDYAGAVRDLQTAMDRGYIPAADRASTYYNMSQLYMQGEDISRALEYMNKWVQAGGKPDRNQKWQLAVLNHKVDDNRESIKWAEQVFQQDGPNAKREVYDFLIYLYDKTNQLAKKAQLLETLLQRNPGERQLWDAIAGDYFRGGNERRAFEVQKAMYFAGLLKSEDEIMRIVNFYNRFDAPYQGAKILEKEINAGRVEKTYEKLELLANLYQVAREFEKAIPVIEQAAKLRNSGQMYERLGRSYAELKQWAKTEEAMTNAINSGNIKDRGTAWVLIGQSRYERNDREGAREAFRKANNRGGRGWLQFMASEEQTERELFCFDIRSAVLETQNEQKACKQVAVLGEAQLPENCKTVETRLEEAQSRLKETKCDRSA